MTPTTVSMPPHGHRPVGHAAGADVLWADNHSDVKALRLAAHLARLGIRADDRVLLIADNCAEYPFALLALCHLDASIVLADAQVTAAQARRILEIAKVRWVLRGEAVASAAFEPVGDSVPPTVLDLLAEHGIAAETNGASDDELSLDRWEQRRDAIVMWSSGTTGEPKAVVKSGHAVLQNSRVSAEATGYRRTDILTPLLPFSHQYGMSLLLIWWLTRCGLLVTPYRRPDLALAAAAAAKASVVDSTPPVYQSLLSLFARQPSRLEALRGVQMWCVGGAPLPRPLADRFKAVTGHDLLDGYGMTEMGNIALATPGRIGGCGPPLPGVELRILDDSGAPVAPGSVGEIAVRTPGRMEGYLRSDGAIATDTTTASAAEPKPWYRTSDLGHLDDAGHLHVLGRKNAVHRMGHTLYPDYLERRAEECGAPVKVLALDDERRGSALVLFVQSADADVRAWRLRLRDRLAPFERPNAVVVIPEFPLTPTGKVDMTALRETAAKCMAYHRR